MILSPNSLFRGLALTAALWLGTEALFAALGADALKLRACVRYFILAFGGLNAVLLAWAAAVPRKSTVKKSGKRALGGLVGHFAGSLALALVYFFIWFDGSRACAAVAVTAYLAAFPWFVYRLSLLK